jgi:beta-galactosidase
MMFLVHSGLPERIEKWVEKGGIFVSSYWSGIVDENALCFTGGFPGPLRKLLGIWSEELDVLYPGDERSVFYEPQNVLGFEGAFKATQYCDLVHAESAQVVARYGSGFYTQMPALTVNKFGKGEAFYIASKNDANFHLSFGRSLASRAGLTRALNKALPQGVVARKRSGEREYLFLMNIIEREQHVQLGEPWLHMLSGETVSAIGLPAFGTAVLRSLQ